MTSDKKRAMEVTLEQAIEIHAKALKWRSGRDAPLKARKIAQELAQAGDHEGYRVWLKVGDIAEALLKDNGQSLNAMG
jgi:hypothetical protein